jgi:hypothetical protein
MRNQFSPDVELADPLFRETLTPELASDSRPLWQRLDEAEDQLLIKRRKAIQRIRNSVLLLAAAVAYYWLMTH